MDRLYPMGLEIQSVDWMDLTRMVDEIRSLSKEEAYLLVLMAEPISPLLM